MLALEGSLIGQFFKNGMRRVGVGVPLKRTICRRRKTALQLEGALWQNGSIQATVEPTQLN